MNNKLITVAEAIINMTESLLRLLDSIKNAKIAIDNMLRMQYKAAGCPFGESEEGLLLWREQLAKDYALSHNTAECENRPGNVVGVSPQESRYESEYFSSLTEEVQKRRN